MGKPAEMSELDWHEGMTPPDDFPDWPTYAMYMAGSPRFVSSAADKKERSKGQPRNFLQAALVLKYKALGCDWDEIKEKVEAETRVYHDDAQHYEKVWHRYKKGAKYSPLKMPCFQD
jgi:hypothetical protein